MPKNISRVKTANGAVVMKRPCSKFRIGSRKGGKSALLMTSDELKDVLNDQSKKRYHAKAVAVLRMRGVEVEWPRKLVEEVNGLEAVVEEIRAGGTA